MTLRFGLVICKTKSPQRNKIFSATFEKVAVEKLGMPGCLSNKCCVQLNDGAGLLCLVSQNC